MKKAFLVFASVFAALLLLAAALALVFSFQNLSFLPGQIAVIPVKGEIVSSSDPFFSSPSVRDTIELIELAEQDPSVSAVMLEIDSPGGTIVASKELVRAIRRTEKPVVAFISEVGASGAYYAASASDLVVADPDSITGSIGVISVSPNLEGLLEKIGVKMKILKEGEFKDLGSPFKEMSEQEEEILQEILSQAFESFKGDVLEFRKGKLNPKEFEEVADGRILSGRQAKAFGLVDVLGGRGTALKEAAMLAGIEGKPREKELKKKTRFDLFNVFANAGFAFGSGFRHSLSPDFRQPIFS